MSLYIRTVRIVNLITYLARCAVSAKMAIDPLIYPPTNWARIKKTETPDT